MISYTTHNIWDNNIFIHAYDKEAFLHHGIIHAVANQRNLIIINEGYGQHEWSEVLSYITDHGYAITNVSFQKDGKVNIETTGGRPDEGQCTIVEIRIETVRYATPYLHDLLTEVKDTPRKYQIFLNFYDWLEPIDDLPEIIAQASSWAYFSVHCHQVTHGICEHVKNQPALFSKALLLKHYSADPRLEDLYKYMGLSEEDIHLWRPQKFHVLDVQTKTFESLNNRANANIPEDSRGSFYDLYSPIDFKNRMELLRNKNGDIVFSLHYLNPLSSTVQVSLRSSCSEEFYQACVDFFNAVQAEQNRIQTNKENLAFLIGSSASE